MELQEFVRKPFPVKAVQVDFANAYEVAEWCKGAVQLKKTRLLGGAGKGEMDLPTVVFKGTGDYRDKEFTAGLGDWIVELRGNFRVFKKAQFKATFDPAPKKVEEPEEEFINPGDSTDEIAGKLGFKPVDYCPDHDKSLSECGEWHIQNAEEADLAAQEQEDALHNAGQL